MDKLIYNKIKEKLGILAIDDDSSISYQHTSINSTYTNKIDIEELYNIFVENPEDIFNSVDTRHCISFILDDGQEISLTQYQPSTKPVLLKITTDALIETGNEIFLSCTDEHFVRYNMSWEKYPFKTGEYFIDEIKAAADYDGFKHTKAYITDKILNTVSYQGNDVIDYCSSKVISINQHTYQGYLPAVGQLMILSSYIELINYIFDYCGFNKLSIRGGAWWSSTEKDQNYAWHLWEGWTIDTAGKGYGYFVVPMFKKLN